MTTKDYVKTIISGILLAALLFALCAAPCVMLIEYGKTQRNERCLVVEVNGDVVTVEDASGNLWEFTSDRTYWEGEVVTVRFHNQGTESIYDDEITMVKTK